MKRKKNLVFFRHCLPAIKKDLIFFSLFANSFFLFLCDSFNTEKKTDFTFIHDMTQNDFFFFSHTQTLEERQFQSKNEMKNFFSFFQSKTTTTTTNPDL